MKITRKHVFFAFVLLLSAVIILRSCNQPDPQPQHPIVIDTVPQKVLIDSLQVMQRIIMRAAENEKGFKGTIQKLQNRITGLEARRPESIKVSESKVDLRFVPVMRGVTIDPKTQRMTIIDAQPDSNGMHRERMLQGIDLRNCDDGITIAAGFDNIACNAAVLGHMAVVMNVETGTSLLLPILFNYASLEAGLKWKRCYRCGVNIMIGARMASDSIGFDKVRLFIRGEKTIKDLW